MKNTLLVVYTNYRASEHGACLHRCLCCRWKTQNLLIYPNVAVGISHGYIINWKSGQIGTASQDLDIALMTVNSD